ncbi:ATP-binding cassette domain-containing protein [Enterococcus alishanensis]
MPAVIELNQISKKFGKFEALKDVSFTLKQGEVMGFIGPNGAGKSTTIRILLGMLKKTSGEATIFGEDVWHEDTKIHQRIAYVPGDVYLWPNLTGGEIIDLLLRLNNQERNQKTTELIDLFQLDPKKKARSYSKGNRQKVALIAALSQEADLYIFDEPTSGLDPLNEKTFQNEVMKLKAAGKSILLSSHILSEVEKMCDHITIIREGEIIESGDLASMRHLTFLQITVETKESLADLKDFTGVEKISINEDDRKAVLSVNNDQLNLVLAELTKKEIITITTAPPTLEDLFLQYYRKAGESDD